MVLLYRLGTMRTVFFIVTMIIYATADTGQLDALCKNSGTFSKIDSMRPNEISNRVRRNAPEVLNIPDILKLDTIASRNSMQDILSRIPNKDIINFLISERTKRSYIDYDSSEYQEDVNPKKQLEQISSRKFASEAYNKDQRSKLFFSQLFSMIDGNVKSETSENDYENDDSLRSNKSLTEDSGELFLEMSQKDDKSNTDLDKNVYVPVRKNKRRRQIQDRRSFPSNLKNEKNLNARPERQLGDIINDDNIDTQFYKINKYAPRTSQDYDDIEKEQLLQYGPVDYDIIETSPVYLLSTTTGMSINHDSVEKADYNSNFTNISPFTLDSKSISPFTKSEIIDVTEQAWIPTQYTFNTFDQSRGPANKESFKNKSAESSSITKSTYTSNVEQSIEDIAEKIYRPINTKTSNVDSAFMITNIAIKKPDDQNQSPYPDVTVKDSNDFDKTQSRFAGENIDNKNVKSEKIYVISKIGQEEAGQTQDIKVASVYGESNVRTNQSNINPLSARIKLDFLIQLPAVGNDEY